MLYFASSISLFFHKLVDGIGSKITDFISSRAEAELVNAAGDKSLEAIEGTDATNVKGMELFLSHYRDEKKVNAGRLSMEWIILFTHFVWSS